MGGFAWVTLATNDSYSLGALVLAHSLKQVGTAHQLAVLVTPGVTNAMRQKLSAVFNVVQEVNILDSKDETNLRLLKRPELGVTFTKLHCWRLTQFDKCVFLDADTLVLQNCDELFEREELSAAPDVGWPDCFNSGVFVYRPSNETYENLVQFALEKGSFDGGDQGLLNLYFSDWATKDISKHLPFIYNLCSTACYSYLPAFKQFGGQAKIIHFIGSSKPWLQYFNTETQKVQPTQDLKHLEVILQHWWSLFCTFIHSHLSPEMSGLAGAFAQLTLGAPRTAEQNALDDHLRRQGWEVGNIDYLGRDSFDNIWSKICQTLSTGFTPAAKTTEEIPSPTSAQETEKTVTPEPPQSTLTAPPSETSKPVTETPLEQPKAPETESIAQPTAASETVIPTTEPQILECSLPPKAKETAPLAEPSKEVPTESALPQPAASGAQEEAQKDPVVVSEETKPETAVPIIPVEPPAAPVETPTAAAEPPACPLLPKTPPILSETSPLTPPETAKTSESQPVVEPPSKPEPSTPTQVPAKPKSSQSEAPTTVEKKSEPSTPEPEPSAPEATAIPAPAKVSAPEHTPTKDPQLTLVKAPEPKPTKAPEPAPAKEAEAAPESPKAEASPPSPSTPTTESPTETSKPKSKAKAESAGATSAQPTPPPRKTASGTKKTKPKK